MLVLELLPRALRRLRVLLRRNAVEREMADEMAFHLELEIEDRMRQGMDPAEARRTALVDFGGVERYKEEARTARGVRAIEDLAQDGRYALRVLRNSPAFTLTSIFTVAIGIAATTAVLSAANALLFRGPPVASPKQLFVVSEVWKGGDKSWETSMGQYMYRYAHYRDLRDATTNVFDGLAGYRYGSMALRTGDAARSVAGLSVSPNYFDVLGLHPWLGRFFLGSGRSSAADPEVVLGHDFWRREFGADRSVIGKPLFIDGKAFSVVGVAPAGFTGTMVGLPADIWLATNDGSLTMIGRLAAGITPERAVATLTAVGRQLPADAPAQRIARVVLDPLLGVPAMARAPVVDFVGILMATATLVLLIVASNIAGLFLARSAHRRREIAVRLALGAPRWRIIRQLLTESVVLCTIGGTLGVVFATWLTRLALAIDLPVGPRTSFDIHPDATVLLVSSAVALTVAVIAGLMPALESTRIDLVSGLRGVGARHRHHIGRARSHFVIAQLAMALVLLVTAGLFARAVQRGIHVDRGLDARGVIIAEITVGGRNFDRERGSVFYSDLLDNLRTRRELVSVALGEYTPLSASNMGQGMTTPDGYHIGVTWGIATAGFTETMHIPVVAGRPFAGSDTRTSNPVVLVNETLARAMWPGASPIGQHLDLQGEREVIGVIHDGKYRKLEEAPTAYALIPFAQHYSDRMTIYARLRGEPSAGVATMRAAVSRLDRNIALEHAGVLDEQLAIYTLPQRVAAWCVGLFGLFGLVLAAFGVYGVIAYAAAQRTKELGIRLALGAQSRDVIHELLRPAVRSVLIGTLAGLPVALAVGRLSRSFLFGVGAFDAPTFVAIPLLLAAVTFIASYLPARQAARTDPIVSLRAD